MNNNGRHIPILGANGAPTKLNLSVQYSPGPLATPVVLPPINAEGGYLAPVFGGATRMETVASRILSGILTPASFGECAHDPAYRRHLVHAAVVIAWELIGYAASFAPEKETPDEAAGESENPPEPENRSGIVLPD